MNPQTPPHVIAQYDQLRAHASEILSTEHAAQEPDRQATNNAFYKRGVLLALAGEKIPEDLLPFAVQRAQDRLTGSHDHTPLNEELATLHLAQIVIQAGKLITKLGLNGQ